MGCSPDSKQFMQQQLLLRPHTIIWSPPRQVTVLRGTNNKLGFHFKTVPCKEDETVTFIVLIKTDCRVGPGNLHVGDRIVSISNLPITSYNESEIKRMFIQLQDPVVNLQVSSMSRADANVQIKRFLSINSGASGGSATASVDSGERPQVKRFAKSNSTETQSFTPSLSSLDTPAVENTSQGSPTLVPKGTGPSQIGNLPHMQHNNNIHSLPARMEDDIILTDDIVVCVTTNGPSSLPPVLTPLPNTLSPSTNQHMANLCATTTSTGIGGAFAVGGKTVGTAGNRSLGVDVCRAPGCNSQKMCLWHKFVLTFPQYVIWEAFTKTVQLEKNHSSSFGFKYKVKKHNGPPAELFALVTEVMPGGVAWTQLLAGDWIRSINSTPVNTAKEAFRPDFRNLLSVRLVIQRPEGLSSKGIPYLKQLAQSLGINLHIPPPHSTDSAPSSQLQVAGNDVRHGSASQAPRRSEQQHASPMKAVMAGCGGTGNRDLRLHIGSSAADPLLDQYPRLAQSPGECIPLTTLPTYAQLAKSSVSDMCVLPWVRVVVCGAHGSATDFVRGLLADCNELVVEPEAIVQSFHLSVHHNKDSGILINSQLEHLTALLQDTESCAHGVRSGGQGIEGGLRGMNIELYVINDEEFFHHCSSWLLPTCSLVLLTFHVNKLLNLPLPETGRLGALVHTVRACCEGNRTVENPHMQVLMYGVPSGSQCDMSIEEVRTSFYVTDCGSRLLEHHALAVANPSCSSSMAAARLHLFSVCQKCAHPAPVHQSMIKIVDILLNMSVMGIHEKELNALVNQAIREGDPVTLQSVIDSLLTIGSLIPFGGSRPNSEPADRNYLLPFNLFQALSSLLIKPELDTHSPESRQKWFRLMTTGRVTRSELLEILTSESDTLTPELLEHLGIAFKFQPSSPVSQSDSGYGEDSSWEYVIPYFLMDSTSGTKKDGVGFVLKFDSYVSWRDYFNILGKLSMLPGTEEVMIQAQCYSSIRHNRLQLWLHRKKDWDNDNVLITVKRSDNSSVKVIIQQLEQLFSAAITRTSFKLYPADTAIPSSNQPTGPAENPPEAACRPMHLRVDEDEEETELKPAVQSSLATGASEERAQIRMPLRDLPWSVLNQAAVLLSVNMATGHDWRSVAERTGRSIAEICAYESICSKELPAMNFLCEWVLTGTVQRFLDILEEIERPDVRNIILNHLRDQTPNRD